MVALVVTVRVVVAGDEIVDVADVVGVSVGDAVSVGVLVEVTVVDDVLVRVRVGVRVRKKNCNCRTICTAAGFASSSSPIPALEAALSLLSKLDGGGAVRSTGERS